MKRALALLLVALTLAPLAAAAPVPQPWSTYNARSAVNAVALSAEGTTIVAGLAAPTTTAPVTPTQLPGTPTLPAQPCATSTTQSAAICTDAAILDFATGFQRNGTPSDSPSPRGVSHVAASRNGRAVATIGVDGAPNFENLTLDFHFLTGANWSTGEYNRSFVLGQVDLTTPIGVALSDDGARVVVLMATAAGYSLRGWQYGGGALAESFNLQAPGVPRALAGSGDLNRILVAGQFPEGNFTYGGGYVVPFGQSLPLSSFFDRTTNNTDATSAAISRDGMTLAIGGPGGKLNLFRGGSLSQNLSITTAASLPVTRLAMSDDAGRLSLVQNTTLAHFDITATPRMMWNATVPGANVTGLALNRTGTLVVVSSMGTGAGVFGYDDESNAPLWTIPGVTSALAVDATGERIVYGAGTFVGAARIERSLVLTLAAGGKVAPQQEIQIPGTKTFEVLLRNDGSAVERVIFEEGAPEITVSTEPRVVPVRPGATVRVNVTVAVDQPLPGPRVFNVTARSISSGLLDNVTLALTPKPTLDVKLVLNETDVLAEAGKTSEVILTIVNNGTSDSNVAIRALQTVSSGPLWDLKLSESQLTATRGTRSSVKVSMTPPADIANGTSSTVSFTLEGQDIFDTARVTFRVNPDLKVEVNASGVTKLIEPGKTGSYNVTVTNTGSLPRAFEVFFDITESNDRNWGVEMQTQTLRLDPLQKRVFQVKIVAPADVQPNERVSVLVGARSIPERVNETRVEDNVTLFGVAVPLRITTTTTPDNGIPFVAPLSVIAIALIATALRRRRL